MWFGYGGNSVLGFCKGLLERAVVAVRLEVK